MIHSLHGRPGHKKECKQARRVLTAAAIAAAGDGEAAQTGPPAPSLSAVNSSFASNVKESNGRTYSAPCDHCAAGTPEVELLLCTGCHHARYCSTACQRGAWFVGFVDW